jgi:hypothetical protein
MSDRNEKKFRKIVRNGFQQDYSFFIDTLKSWPFVKRLAFCRDIMLKRL